MSDKITCPKCSKDIELHSRGAGRCECGAHVKVLDYDGEKHKEEDVDRYGLKYLGS